MASYIVGIILFSISLILLLNFLRLANLAKASEKWPSANGEIVKCKITTTSQSDSPRSWHLWLKYNYTVNDKTYSSSRVFFGSSIATPDTNEMFAFEEAFKQGKTHISVYYYPSRPALCVLKTGIHKNLKIAIGITFFAALLSSIAII